MTIFGWDASNHDATPTARDGLDFYTHKVSDGDHFYADPFYSLHMSAAHGLGIPVLGSYHVLHGQRSIASQADWWLALVQGQTPWWRTMPAWIWQCDAEPFGYNITPTIAEINALGDAICQRAQIPASSYLAYAPSWVYGSSLTGLKYRQWQSSYGPNAAGWYRNLYPGDSSPRWVTSVTPLILQYGSNATIANQTTSDANAYRGTIDQLIADLNGGSMTTLDSTTRWGITYATAIGDMWWAEFKGNPVSVVQQSLARIEAALAANETADAARDAALTELVKGVAINGNGISDAQLAILVAAVRDAASAAGSAAQAAILAKTDALHAELLKSAQDAAAALSANI